MKIFISENLDPWYNLAFEYRLFCRKDLEKNNFLILWRNNPAVIIGRFQNPWLECRLNEMESANIAFARRESGGGAVYHDPGNINFSFISDDSDSGREDFTGIIIKGLKDLGIRAVKGQRNDIYIDGKKISGSASKFSSGKILHHGTILFNSDLDSLNYYLRPCDYKSGMLKALGTQSVSSPVINLKDYDTGISCENLYQAIIENTEEYFGKKGDISEVNLKQLEKNNEIKEYMLKIKKWEWLFGSTPGFSLSEIINSNGQEIECDFSVKKGIISEVNFKNRNLGRELMKDITENYTGNKCDILLKLKNNILTAQ